MRITKDGLWRVAYGDNAEFTEEQLRERLPAKFRNILPGNPEPDQYQVQTMAIFRMHQRCVSDMRKGRVLLAGDAAHLCNPMYASPSNHPLTAVSSKLTRMLVDRGGLGLTGGIEDIGSLADCLLGIYTGKADLNILDKYDEVRRGIYRDIIDPLSMMNMERMSQDPETVLENDAFLQFAAAAGKDPELAAKMFEVRDLWLQLLVDILRTDRKLVQRDLTLGYDMTQFYNKEENGTGPAHLPGPLLMEVR